MLFRSKCCRNCNRYQEYVNELLIQNDELKKRLLSISNSSVPVQCNTVVVYTQTEYSDFGMVSSYNMSSTICSETIYNEDC